MPGIVTHNRVLRDSIELLSKRKRRGFLLQSIRTLFHSPEFLRAGYFGALGPDIFDYIPRKRKNAPFGSDISFSMHEGKSSDVAASMIRYITSYVDKNNEWLSYQRAYLYGYISHMVADSMMYPFIYYYSGFPDKASVKERKFYREQNLLFQYNIDNFFLYFDEKKILFIIDDIFPIYRRDKKNELNPAVKELILHAISETFPDHYSSLFLPVIKQKELKDFEKYSFLDLLPNIIKKIYSIKQTKNKKVRRFMKELSRKGPGYSDHYICYPEKKYFHKDSLNFHKDRWQYPVEKPGFHYESLDNLMSLTCERVTEIWEKIEASMFGKLDESVYEDLRGNLYTGVSHAGYFEMIHKNPIRLKY